MLECIQLAERPVLLVGNGVRIAGGQDVLLRLVEHLQIPVLRTWMGADLIPDSHPCCFGKPGTIAPRGPIFILQNCDLSFPSGEVGFLRDRFRSSGTRPAGPLEKSSSISTRPKFANLP